MALEAAPVFGRVENPVDEWESVDPFPFTIVGYTNDDERTETDFSFQAIGMLSLGAHITAGTVVDGKGRVDNQRIIEYLMMNLIPEDRGRFMATLSDDRYLFHAETLVELADYLREIREDQAPRPTTPPSGSSRGRTRRDLTSVPATERKGSGTSTRSSRSR